MTDQEMLNEMLKMQDELNKQIMKEKSLTCIDENELSLAILDEIGELNHELKGLWCWWKDTQSLPIREKVLEEEVDIFHFVMTKELIRYKGDIHRIVKDKGIYLKYDVDLEQSVRGIKERFKDLIQDESLATLILLNLRLGFKFSEVYEMYLKKNKVNYERLKNGY